jgi:cupin 2 domain-containing protein
MSVRVHNIFADGSAAGGEEKFLALFESSSVKIERIVSNAHSSPANFWYDQAEHEWVMLVRGGATLEFAYGRSFELKEGDYLNIPPHVRHRIRQTAPDTIWLAVHVSAKGKAQRAKRKEQRAKRETAKDEEQTAKSKEQRGKRKSRRAKRQAQKTNGKGQKEIARGFKAAPIPYLCGFWK